MARNPTHASVPQRLLLLLAPAVLIALLQAPMGVSAARHTRGARPAPKPPGCWVRHQARVVDVGGYLGWALGMYGVWQQPPVYVGDKLRFTWPAPNGGDGGAGGGGDSSTHKEDKKGKGEKGEKQGESENGSGREDFELSGRLLKAQAGGQLMEHNVYQMGSKTAFNACSFRGSTSLSEKNYTTPALSAAGTYYYSCEEDGHCTAGQKVAVVVVAAPAWDPCPSPPPPLINPGDIPVGVDPTYWTIGVESWTQPPVTQGNRILFIWNANTAAPPHDVWKFPSKTAYDNCDFSAATSYTGVTDTGSYAYTVTESAGDVLYFGCGYTYHCAAQMKVTITIT